MKCSRCRASNPDDAIFCRACQTPFEHAGAEWLLYAGFWRRAFAFLIDVIILYILGFIVIYYAGIILGNAGLKTTVAGASFISHLLQMTVNWLYFTLLESSAVQATIGKMALRVFVTDLDGRRISFVKANARFWSKLISGLILLIGFFMAGFTAKKQALHDIIARTLVITR